MATAILRHHQLTSTAVTQSSLPLGGQSVKHCLGSPRRSQWSDLRKSAN